MARTIEFMKRQEARIIVYLLNTQNWRKNGNLMSVQLSIDYIYTMKLLRAMYDKGWIKTHIHNSRTFFSTTLKTPIKEAKKSLPVGKEKHTCK